jgi:hypothetical protein
MTREIALRSTSIAALWCVALTLVGQRSAAAAGEPRGPERDR